MSIDHPAAPSSDSSRSADEAPSQNAPQPDAAAPARSRNPREKVVVWILIVALGAFAGYEALTQIGHRNTVAAVDDAYRTSAKRASDYLMSDAVRADMQARIDSGMSEEAADAAAVAAAIESNPDLGRRLTITQAEALMSGFPRKSVEPVSPVIMNVTYHWKTLLKDYGGIQLRYQVDSGEIVQLVDFAPGEDL